jgi:hypothetical protein
MVPINYYQHVFRDRPAAEPRGLPPYVVLCLEPAASGADGHTHVSYVETRDPDGGQTRWSTVQVIAAVRDGERFVVADDGRGGQTVLEPAICSHCSTVTLAVDARGPAPPPCR